VSELASSVQDQTQVESPNAIELSQWCNTMRVCLHTGSWDSSTIETIQDYVYVYSCSELSTQQSKKRFEDTKGVIRTPKSKKVR